ncbi:MAG: hypothetical protein JXX14_14620 [Deltaproteobacteria bacterium]|nr:hypothetical protein [Deltaproteobacteria bacterium]
MIFRKWLMVGLILGSVFGATGVLAMPAAPSDRPTDNVEKGNARVFAWRTLRLDLDTLNHGDVHPMLVHEWLTNASEVVLRHIANHAMDPTLVQSAAYVLIEKNAGDVALFAELSQRWTHSPRLPWFQAARVRAGDTAYTATLHATLAERSDVLRVTAAAILTLAADRQGKKTLLDEIRNCGSQVIRAAQIIGNSGAVDDRATLEKSIASGCSEPALRRASGEILFRELYPVYHELLVRRDTSDTRYQAPGGMYAAWFDIVRHAHASGVSSLTALLPWLGQFREYQRVWPGESPEVSRRNLDALIEFLSTAAQRIRQSRPRASWPQNWQTALQNLANESSDGFAARVSAALSILSWTDDMVPATALDPLRGATILSPRGNRVTDGNWRTSWQGKKGSTLELEWFPLRHIDTLWLAAGCVNAPQSRLKKIKILVAARDGNIEKTLSLNPTSLYYQPVSIDHQSVRKITIQIMETSDTTPVCINEIRIAGR